jgi:hypothetical protein
VSVYLHGFLVLLHVAVPFQTVYRQCKYAGALHMTPTLPRTYLTTSPTFTLPFWCNSNILSVRFSSACCSLHDGVQRKYEGSGRWRPASAIWARE